MSNLRHFEPRLKAGPLPIRLSAGAGIAGDRSQDYALMDEYLTSRPSQLLLTPPGGVTKMRPKMACNMCNMLHM